MKPNTSPITKVQINGQDVTPLVSPVNGVPVVQPAKLPREAVVTTPKGMEPHEIRFIAPQSVHLDPNERL